MLFHFPEKTIRSGLLLALLNGLYILNFFHRQLPAVLAPQLSEAFALSMTQVGWLYGTAFAVLYALTGLALTLIPGRRPLHLLIPAAAALWSVATLLHAMAGRPETLFAARGLLAIAQAAVTPMIYALPAHVTPPARLGLATSIFASGIFTGITLSFAGAGSALLQHPWTTVFEYAGAAGLIYAALLYFVLPPCHITAPPAALSLRTLMAPKGARWHMAGFALLSVSGYAVLAFASTFIRQHAGGAAFVPSFGWFAAGCALTVPLAGRLADRRGVTGNYRRFDIPIATAIAGLALYATGLNANTAEMAFVLFGLGMTVTSSFNGLAPALLQDRYPEALRMQAGALYLLAVNLIGLGGGPVLAGWLADTTGSLPAALTTVIVLGNGGGILALLQARRAWKAVTGAQ